MRLHSVYNSNVFNLGTVRCYLEKHQEDFEAVVFSVKKSDLVSSTIVLLLLDYFL